MKRPVSSMMPTRSASPSVQMHRSWLPTFMSEIVESMLGGIGSGLMPPNSGLRWLCSSVTVVLPPPIISAMYPYPDPYMHSWTIRRPAFLIASTSTMRAICA